MSDPRASTERALHEQDPLGRFGSRALEYRLHRPSYPPAAIAAVLAGLAEPARVLAIDLGAGTGISARMLADLGPRVLALEPNPQMRAAAEPHSRVSWCAARAEALPLADGSVDLVLAAQAFHWFEPRAALRECARVLRRPGVRVDSQGGGHGQRRASGRLALLWNVRDLADPLTARYSELVGRAAGRSMEEGWDSWSAALAESGLFGTIETHRFAHEQQLDCAGLIGRALSASYVPKQGPELEELCAGLVAAHARHADSRGQARLVYRTTLYLAEPRAA